MYVIKSGDYWMKKRKLIGVITTDPDNIYQVNVMKGIFAKAKELDYDVAVFTTFVKSNHLNKQYLLGETNIYNMINFDLLDGVIMLTISFKYSYDNMIYNRLLDMVNEKCTCPVITIDESFGDYDIVNVDDERAFEKITDHVIETHKCKKIYFLAGEKDTYTSNIREKGFRNSLKAHNIDIPEENIFYGEFWYTFGERVAKQLVDGELEKPEAIIAASDYIALGLVNDCKKYGIRIPEELIVTGYDGVIESQTNYPTLTTYVPPIFEAGEEAIVKLVQKIEGRKIPYTPKSIGTLKCGMSCGCKLSSIVAREKDDYGYIIPYNEPGTDMSRFIDSYMAEFLTESVTIEECMYNIMSMAYLIDDCDEYFLCLCPGWDEYDVSSETNDTGEIGYTDKMKICVYRCTEQIIQEGASWYSPISIDTFDTSQMLPRLFEGERKEPVVFHFVPIHFNGRRMGYAVTRFPIEKATFNFIYRNWTRNVNNALEMIRVRNQLFLKSIRDPMTGLYNRAGMKANLKDVIKKSKTRNSQIFVIDIDMNNLKYINDTFGHGEGDKAIKTLAITVYSVCGNDDICVRTGGDEFFVVGECNYGEDFVKKRVEKIIQKLDSYNQKSGAQYDITASFGLCCSEAENEEDIEKMIRIADERMYIDKATYKKSRDNNISVR